jgi:type I restriction enzyme S subunit
VESRGCPQGYKQTEIGVIPTDWNICELGSLAPFIGSGKTNTNNKGEYPLFGSTGKIGTCKAPEYKGDAILVARVGANAGRLNFVTGEYGVSDNTIIVRIEKSSNVNYFKYQLINKNLNSLVFGSGQPLITGSQLKALFVPVPDVKEQTAIANALSDVDALITSLEKLIAKKRAIKTATMQQLLTGKKRLPPFDLTHTGYKQTELGEIPEDWLLDSIGNVLSITTGDKNTQDKIADGQYPFFVRSQIVERINSYSFDGEAVLTAGDGVGTGKIFHYINGKFDYHQRVYLMHNFCERLDGYYFYVFFSNHFYDRIMSMTAKSSVDSVRREMIADMKIILPSIDEQIAISKALSDMGKEIDVLEQRLNKTQQLKQGMMQELLTGRTRLI